MTKKDIIILTISSAFFIITLLLGIYSLEVYSSNEHVIFTSQTPEKNILQRKLVYISGAINKPGIYEVNDDMRITELVLKAGGFKEDVDKVFVNEKLNLSKTLEDQEHIFIPYESSSFSTSDNTNSNNGKVNINTASMDELEELPDVGPSTAEKIIDARPFNSVEDLKNVSGIGDKTFDKLKDLISV